jgi:hypothetical protein
LKLIWIIFHYRWNDNDTSWMLIYFYMHLVKSKKINFSKYKMCDCFLTGANIRYEMAWMTTSVQYFCDWIVCRPLLILADKSVLWLLSSVQRFRDRIGCPVLLQADERIIWLTGRSRSSSPRWIKHG